MSALRDFVQRLADSDPEGGRPVIAHAGMYVKNTTGPLKGGFTVKRGRVS